MSVEIAGTPTVNSTASSGVLPSRANPWLVFAAKRLLSLAVTLLVLVLAAFSLVRLIPGDPTLAIAGLGSTAEGRAQIRAQLGLDRPYFAQLVIYMKDLLHGNLGTSYITNEPIAHMLSERLAVSGKIAFLALAVVLVVSVPLGLTMGAFTRDDRHRKSELGFTAATSVLGAIPEFLMATLLAAVFAVWLRVLPVAGISQWNWAVLPVAAVAIRPTFLLSRIVRLETLNALAQDYVRTARSKRLSNWRIYVRHVLPNALTASLTVGGILLASLIAGTVLVENVFALPGLGTQLVNSIQQHDYPAVQGIVLVLGVIVVITNAVVDVALSIIDRRSLVRVS